MFKRSLALLMVLTIIGAFSVTASAVEADAGSYDAIQCEAFALGSEMPLASAHLKWKMDNLSSTTTKSSAFSIAKGNELVTTIATTTEVTVDVYTIGGSRVAGYRLPNTNKATKSFSLGSNYDSNVYYCVFNTVGSGWYLGALSLVY